MKLKNTDKFKITFARTERLKKSSIPYMKRLLNKHYKQKIKTGSPMDGDCCD